VLDHGNHDHNNRHTALAELDLRPSPKRKGLLAPHTRHTQMMLPVARICWIVLLLGCGMNDAPTSSIATAIPEGWLGDYDLNRVLEVSGKSAHALRLQEDGVVESWNGYMLGEMIFGEPRGRFSIHGNTANVKFSDGSTLNIEMTGDMITATSMDGGRYSLTRNVTGLPPGGRPLVPVAPSMDGSR